MADNAFIAIDWGTTNRRIYLIDSAGAVLATERDDRGVLAMAGAGYAEAVADIRARHGDLPVIAAGMVGATVGWRAVPYVAAPATLADLAAALAEAGDRVWIVPGVRTADGARADVMRGEEVQLLGAAAAGLVPPDALLCQPGTHCKWATLKDGALADFTTAMTGELFALLGRHSLLSAQLGGAVDDGPAFREGLDEGARGDLLASLFGVRAAGLLDRRDPADAASYVSGLLIGGDVAARLDGAADKTVHLLADPALGTLYATAIERAGGVAHRVDSHAAFVAGITRIRSLAA